ncbi:hypothetical protein JOS77_05840 [Chromobacterium haemolyticum]|nr:hypothetical protein JOS77_05840 [Chromobacterium haemolyticum]
MSTIDPNPHKEQGLEIYGAPLNQAKLAVVLLHGRRQSALDAYKNGEAIGLADVAYILPIAKDRTWYPHSFMAPLESNQPALDQALDCVEATIEELRGYGFANRQIVLMGFSQGACLAAEFIYRRPSPIGGLIAFSGGLFGPDESAWGEPTAAGLPGLIRHQRQRQLDAAGADPTQRRGLPSRRRQGGFPRLSGHAPPRLRRRNRRGARFTVRAVATANQLELRGNRNDRRLHLRRRAHTHRPLRRRLVRRARRRSGRGAAARPS